MLRPTQPPSPHRRSFLSNLVTLPFIGGGVTLIGAPCRVAQAATDAQLWQYACFALAEAQDVMRHMQEVGTFRDGAMPDAMDRFLPDFPSRHDITLRAPVILSAAGVPLTGERHG